MKSLSLLCAGNLMAAILFLPACIAGPSIAPADVAKEVGEVRSVRFKTTMAQPGPSGQPMTFESILDSSGRTRMTFRQGDAVTSITISDFRTGRTLTLYPEMKQAELMERVNVPADRKVPDVMADIVNIHDKDGTPVGEKVIGGRKAKGFRITTPAGEQTIWADMETRLPVEVDFRKQSQDQPPTSSSWTDFQWNLPLDEALFSLTPPAGYELTTRQMDASPEQEKDLVNALKKLAEFNGGVYPDTFDPEGMLKARLKSSERLFKAGSPDPDSPEWKQLHDPDSPERKKLEERQMQDGFLVYRGFRFASDPKNGDDWHYAGMNVSAGKAGVPIFWYHPKDAANYHVIDADLKVHEVAPADLPQVPSQAVVNPVKKPATTISPKT